MCLLVFVPFCISSAASFAFGNSIIVNSLNTHSNVNTMNNRSSSSSSSTTTTTNNNNSNIHINNYVWGGNQTHNRDL